MSRTLEQVQDEVDGIIKDDDEYVSETARDLAIARAVEILSATFPREVLVEITGDGSTFLFALSAWVDKFSSIESVKYPYAPTSQTRHETLDNIFYDVVSSSGWKIRFLDFIPASGVKALITHTAQKTLTVGVNTLDPEDEIRVIYLASSLCFKVMAAAATAVVGATINADVTPYQSRCDQYLRLAEQYEAMSGLKDMNSASSGGLAFSKILNVRSDGTPWMRDLIKINDD